MSDLTHGRKHVYAMAGRRCWRDGGAWSGGTGGPGLGELGGRLACLMRWCECGGAACASGGD